MNVAVRELLCQKCGREYVPWFGPHAIWNAVADSHPDPSIHFLCMECFAAMADALGLGPDRAWSVEVERSKRPGLKESLNRLAFRLYIWWVQARAARKEGESGG